MPIGPERSDLLPLIRRQFHHHPQGLIYTQKRNHATSCSGRSPIPVMVEIECGQGFLALTFYALYAHRVVEREYGWTDAGKASAARHGVSERETIEALYSSQRIENHVGTLLLAVAGLADTTRVIMVLSERVGMVNSYAILAVRLATPEEVKQWMEGTR